MENLSNLDTNWETIDIKVPKGIISSCEDNIMDVLMNDSTYWSDVEEHLNYVEETNEQELSEYDYDCYDYDCYYFDLYNEFRYELMIENNQIIEDAMNQHMEKRNNSKFINNNKFKNKIRDKRILFRKGMRFILNAALDRRGRKNVLDSSIVSMDLIETTKVQGFQEILLYRQPFLCTFNPFNRYNQSRSTRVVFEAYRPLNIYSTRKTLVLVDYYDRDTVYSIDSKYTIVQQYPHLNFYEKSYTSAELPEEQQVSNLSFYYNRKTSFFGKNVIDSRFCKNQHLYERQSGSWYYHDKLRIKDQVDRFQCIKDIKDGVDVYEDKGMIEDMENAADYYVMELYFDVYEKYPYVVDAHIEPEQWWNEKHISMYKEYPNIHFDEGYDFDMEYEMSLFDVFDDQEDPYYDRFDNDLLDWDQD